MHIHLVYMHVVRVGGRKFFPKHRMAQISLDLALKMFDELTIDSMKASLCCSIGSNLVEKIEARLTPFNGFIRDETWELLFLISQKSAHVLEDWLFSGNLYDRAGQHDGCHIPEELEPLANIKWASRGRTVGCGEVLALLMFRDDISCDPGGRYDLVMRHIHDGNIHVKDHRCCSSTTLGSNKFVDGMMSWEDKRPFTLLKEAGVNVRSFGNLALRGNERLESYLTAVYDDDIHVAAERFEQELHEVMRGSTAFGDAQGVLFLECKEDGLMFVFAPPEEVYFHSTTMDGVIRICRQTGRFAKKVIAIGKKRREKQRREIKKSLRAIECRTKVCKKCGFSFYDTTKRHARKTCFDCNPPRVKKDG